MEIVRKQSRTIKKLYIDTKNNTLENRIEFKYLKAIAKKTIKVTKQNSWQEYLNTINVHTPAKEVWRKIKAIEGQNKFQPITGIYNQDNILTNNQQEIANILANSFTSNSSNSNYDPDFLKYKETIESLPGSDNNMDNSPNNDLLNEDTTLQELRNTLQSSKNTSPGPDNIPNCFLKNLPTNALNYLLNIFNTIWKTNVFPD